GEVRRRRRSDVPLRGRDRGQLPGGHGRSHHADRALRPRLSLGELPDDPSMTRDLRRVSERSHRIDGILYLYGRDVRRGTRIEGATILDVAPTVLALAACHPRSTC